MKKIGFGKESQHSPKNPIVLVPRPTCMGTPANLVVWVAHAIVLSLLSKEGVMMIKNENR